MSRSDDITRELADIQKQLLDLPDDAFAERYELQRRQDELRAEIRGDSAAMYKDRSDESLLDELAALRGQMKAIEDQRIDLVSQAGSGGASTGEMGNLGGVQINKGIDDAHGLSDIKNRIGIIKNELDARGVEYPDPD
ncbi:MAG: hypothetical protein QNJ71_03760 [Acidimicrobiia bacterium]|nr:hypothetical protein [Acidimicrobiia bacterium]